MKTTGITTIGTFYCPPLFPYGIASFYPICNEIMVVNGGYDLACPDEDEYNIQTERISEDIEHLDLDDKIIKKRNSILDDLKHGLKLSTEYYGKENWADMRGIGGILANGKAVERDATTIIKWDSDQVGYSDASSLRGERREDPLPIRVHEGHTSPSRSRTLLPIPTIDSVFIYSASEMQYYSGRMGPSLFVGRAGTDEVHCAHLHHTNPSNLSQEEKFEHFYGRFLFRYREDKLEERAEGNIERMLDNPLCKPSNIPSPEVCEYKDPRVIHP